MTEISYILIQELLLLINHIQSDMNSGRSRPGGGGGGGGGGASPRSATNEDAFIICHSLISAAPSSIKVVSCGAMHHQTTEISYLLILGNNSYLTHLLLCGLPEK